MNENNIQVIKKGKTLVLKLNRPEKKNAITLEMYSKIMKNLKESEDDDDTTIIVMTGTGDYFTSGNDFSMKNIGDQDTDTMVRNQVDYVRKFIYTMIHYPKLLIAVVNGPAVGIGVTMLGLFDLVYCVDNATFHTPFSDLGICAEGCSTYTFPRSMGKSLAAQMLYFNKKITAKDAEQSGFVAELIKHNEIPSVMNKIVEYSNLPSKSLLYTKRMIRAQDLPQLNVAMSWENEYLIQLFQSDDFINAMMTRMSKKSKL